MRVESLHNACCLLTRSCERSLHECNRKTVAAALQFFPTIHPAIPSILYHISFLQSLPVAPATTNTNIYARLQFAARASSAAAYSIGGDFELPPILWSGRNDAQYSSAGAHCWTCAPHDGGWHLLSRGRELLLDSDIFRLASPHGIVGRPLPALGEGRTFHVSSR